MRLHTQTSLALLSTALLPTLSSALGFDCANFHVDNVHFDLSGLGGVHEVVHVEEFDDYTLNTTYVLNICNILKGASRHGDVKCGTSKNICGFERTITKKGGESEQAYPIAGLEPGGGGSKDPEITLLKKQDSETEGVRVKLSGGEYREDQHKSGKPAAAVIDFQCDPDRTGLEGLTEVEEDLDDESDTEKERRMRRDEQDDDDDDKKDDKDNKSGNGTEDGSRSLQFKSFGLVDDKSYILRLDWKTKYACEDYVRDNPKSSGGHWGFFTWLIIILFLCVAAYLIFGSWLNYNRYGARGWDLLPHGDTVRDIPYLFQDWVRRVANTLQGSGSRGGYSAV